MAQTIREQIMALADEDYRKFHSKLVPGKSNIIGVRLPQLRKLAQKIAKEDWQAYLTTSAHDYYEEVMLHGLVIGYAKADIEDILSYTAAFVPLIDNWAVCDSFCGSLKITAKHKERVWHFLRPYLHSKQEFELRFGIVMLLGYYIDETHLPKVLPILDSIKHKGYYVKMAVAWTLSVCYVKFPKITLAYLQNNNLDEFTYNKTLQKITESNRVDKKTKAMIRTIQKPKTLA